MAADEHRLVFGDREPQESPSVPSVPLHLDHDALAQTHAETLAAARRRYSLAARLPFAASSPDGETRGGHRDLLVSEVTPEDSFLRDERRAIAASVVASALEVLDKRESYIAKNRLMADSEMSLAEIARTLGISRERARQLECRAKRKLASSSALSNSAPTRTLQRSPPVATILLR
ncbi:MAG TPA: sigma factor-like helix-turn-helix DNA-binding protein [Polyangiaceae bacterium]|nr:sigma factor-like helix-turn-helix DNA-binding protein [Polyangiaceae bacterium]